MRTVWIFGLSLLCLSGCGGGGVKLQPISGKVTLAGKPVGYGTIEFVPDAAKGNKGPAGSAEIVNGEYNTRNANGKGVIEGAHLVRITGYNQKPVGSEDETVPSKAEPPLFIGYTVNVDKLTSPQDFDVPESARGFDLYKSEEKRRRANDP